MRDLHDLLRQAAPTPPEFDETRLRRMIAKRNRRRRATLATGAGALAAIAIAIGLSASGQPDRHHINVLPPGPLTSSATTPKSSPRKVPSSTAPQSTTTSTPERTTASSAPTTRVAPCAASHVTALTPEWASPLRQQTDDLLQFTNTGDTCELSGYPTLVAAAPGQPDVQAKPGIPVFPPWNGNSIVLPHRSTAQLLVAALECFGGTATTYPYTTLTVAMPGGGSVKVTLPTRNASPNPDQNGHNLTLRISPSCPPYVGYFSRS